MDFSDMAQQCAPMVDPRTMAAVARVESSFNPFAIGVVKGTLVRQPSNREEAVATAEALEKGGYNFSLGISQVNRYNLSKYGMGYAAAFDACTNLRAGASILADCYARAKVTRPDDQSALRAALSCYFSGNFSTGVREGYVAKVVAKAAPGSITSGVAPIYMSSTSPLEARHAQAHRSTSLTSAPASLPAATADTSGPRSALLF